MKTTLLLLSSVVFSFLTLAQRVENADTLLQGKITPLQVEAVNKHLGTMIAISDKIFVGQCVGSTVAFNEQGMPITTYSFASATFYKSGPDTSATLKVAGGKIHDSLYVSVSHAPHFDAGQRYLIFAFDNEKGYANPIVGESGMLKLMPDANNGELYLLNHQARFMVGIEEGGLLFSSKAISGISDGEPTYVASLNAETTPPTASKPGYVSVAIRDSSISARPMPWLDFEQILTKQYGMQPVSPTPVQSHKSQIPIEQIEYEPEGGSIQTCGWRYVYVVMEQLPTNFTPWYGINEDAMWIWNQTMPVFKYTASDGYFGNNNGQSEFGGFPSSQSLQNVYGGGFAWGPYTLAMTIYRWTGNCGQITESDVFVNPNIAFTDNIQVNLSGQAYMYRSTIMHELGHTWGLQNVSETYDYDVHTVMQGGTFGLFEDGRGVHWADAYLIRETFKNQISVSTNIDLGVESYYASNGLKNATLSSNYCYTGGPISINGFTVENNSEVSVNNVSIYFYLSPDIYITQTDYGFPVYYYWIPPFPAESYFSGSFALDIPNVPTGYYYVGAIVQYNTNSSDGFHTNNWTFLNNKIFVQNVADIDSALIGGLHLSPNPTSDKVRLTWQNPPNPTCNVEVFNEAGQSVFSAECASSYETEISLPPVAGIYVVVLEMGGKNYSNKILKQ